MSRRPANRMADPLTRDREPPVETQGSTEATHVVLDRGAPAIVCKACGRAMQSRVLRTRPNGDRDCQCTSCGREFVYSPPRVRLKE